MLIAKNLATEFVLNFLNHTAVIIKPNNKLRTKNVQLFVNYTLEVLTRQCYQ